MVLSPSQKASTDNRLPVNSDVPIDDLAKDRLGFGELAHHLADVFLSNDLTRGLVVGIEGEWGSGKSSLANLALRELEVKKNERRLRIVRFSPWIVGNRDQLLSQLFIELDSVLSELLPPDRHRKVSAGLEKFAQGAAVLAPLLRGAARSGVPAAGTVEYFLNLAGKTASEFGRPSLSKLNEQLRNNLADLDGRVVVFIDDLDRLEPQETVEVLRLVRAVAGFPKVAYLLAYDPSVLAKSVKAALGVEDGKAYFEKIVQASFRIPEPVSFDLRSWLEKEVAAIASHADTTSEARERLERALSFWCSEYISTPRDVIRVANALKLHVAPLAERLDPADGLFVQIVRIHHPELYNWVESYLLRNFCSDPDDYHVGWREAVEDSDGERESKLDKIIGKQGNTQLQFLSELRQHLPQAAIPNSQSPLAFGVEERQQFSSERRLYSPSYFRLYFALSMPAGFLGDEAVSAFLDMCSRDREAAIRHFRDRCTEDRPQGGNMAQVLLSRILERSRDIPADRIPDLFVVLGDSMDDFARRLPELPGSPPRLYGDALEIFRLIRLVDPEGRVDKLKDLFANAASLAWLNGIVLEAIVEHGFADFSGKSEEQRLLAEDEFACVRTEFLKRMKRVRAIDLKEVPYFLSLMYGWYWAGGREEVGMWVQRQCSDSGNFVDLLGRMMSKVSVSRGHGTECNFYLARQTLKMFFGSESAVAERLVEIINGEHPDEVRENAKMLANVIEPLDQKVKDLHEMHDEYLRGNQDNLQVPQDG